MARKILKLKRLRNYLGDIWQTSFIFGNVERMLGHVCVAFKNNARAIFRQSLM